MSENKKEQKEFMTVKELVVLNLLVMITGIVLGIFTFLFMFEAKVNSDGEIIEHAAEVYKKNMKHIYNELDSIKTEVRNLK
jgi:predicted negative regulator of RcsB-dependent stress response